jgi:hypothetical protein
MWFFLVHLPQISLFWGSFCRKSVKNVRLERSIPENPTHGSKNSGLTEFCLVFASTKSAYIIKLLVLTILSNTIMTNFTSFNDLKQTDLEIVFQIFTFHVRIKEVKLAWTGRYTKFWIYHFHGTKSRSRRWSNGHPVWATIKSLLMLKKI